MYKVLGADQQEYGPVGAEELRQWISEGRANGQTKVQAEGSSEWLALGTFPEFTPDLAAAAARTSMLLPAIPMASAIPTKTNGLAIAGFVLGLLGAPSVCCCCLTLPCAVLGLIFSGIGLSQIKRNPLQGGRGLAIAGIILSLLGLLLAVIWSLFAATNAAINPSVFQ